MTSPMLPTRRARWPLLLVLLLAHALLFMAVSTRRMHEAAPSSEAITLRIVPPEQEHLPLPRDPAPPPRARSYAPVPEVQITAPPIETPLAVAPLPAASAASSVTASVRPKLNLSLPLQMQAAGPTAKELTSNDLHAGQPNRKSIEYRIADAAGTLPVETSTTTDGLGSTMVKQGSKCTKIVANRLSTIDPFDSRAKLPPTSGDCFKK